jgi:hypothetical protein
MQYTSYTPDTGLVEFASNSHTSRTKFFPPFNSYTPAWKAKKFPDHCSPALKEKQHQQKLE